MFCISCVRAALLWLSRLISCAGCSHALDPAPLFSVMFAHQGQERHGFRHWWNGKVWPYKKELLGASQVFSSSRADVFFFSTVNIAGNGLTHQRSYVLSLGGWVVCARSLAGTDNSPNKLSFVSYPKKFLTWHRRWSSAEMKNSISEWRVNNSLCCRRRSRQIEIRQCSW